MDFLQKLYRLLWGCSYRLILIRAAIIEYFQNRGHMIHNLVGAMSSYRIRQVYRHPLCIYLLRICNLHILNEVRHKLIAIWRKVFLNIKDHGDKSLQHLLPTLERFLFHNVHYSIGDVVKAFIENFNWAIQYNLGQAKYGSSLNDLAWLLVEHIEYEFQILILKELRLQMAALEFLHRVHGK